MKHEHQMLMNTSVSVKVTVEYFFYKSEDSEDNNTDTQIDNADGVASD